MAYELHNSLADVVVVVGIDSDTGLKPLTAQPEDTEDIFHCEYASQLLAVISDVCAQYPSCSEPRDYNYPPAELRVKKYKRSTLTRRATIKVVATDDMEPVSVDDYNIPALCLPDGAFIKQHPHEARVHSFVLTHITGDRKYATCITYYRPFIAEKVGTKNSHYRLEPELFSSELTDDIESQIRCFVPTCCVVVSRYPNFEIMKDCLSCLVARLKEFPSKFKSRIQEFALTVTRVPVPPHGLLHVSFQMGDLHLIVRPPASCGRLPVDIPLNHIFHYFSLDNVLRIITCLLMQRNMVFVSSNIALLVPVIEGFQALIHPFVWRFVYVPLVPKAFLDLLEAPGTNLYGCHKSSLSKISKVRVVRLISPHCKNYFSISTTLHSSCFPRMKAEFQQNCNNQILLTFFQLMVNIFYDVPEFLKADKKHFNKEQFLECQSEADRPFYCMVMHTDMFRQFLNNLIDHKIDWSRAFMLPSTTDQQPSSMPARRYTAGASTRKSRTLMKKSSSTYASLNDVAEPLQKTSEFLVPHVMSEKGTLHYYQRCIQQLNNLQHATKSKEVLCSCLYMKGLMEIAAGQLMEGLQTLNELNDMDFKLFPIDVVQKVMLTSSEKQRGELEQMAFFRDNSMWKKLASSETLGRAYRDLTVSIESIPKRPVNLETFAKHVEQLDIAVDHEVITRLFRALTFNKDDVVAPKVFKRFYDTWNSQELECQQVDLPTCLERLDWNECILKVSAPVKTDYGMGRIGLTQKRLFYLEDTTNEYQEIIQLRDIDSIEKFNWLSVFSNPRNPSVRIYSKVKGAKPFRAALKKECDICLAVIKELWSGRLRSVEEQDIHLIQQAARNGLIVDAFLTSHQKTKQPWSEVLAAAAGLCYFTQCSAAAAASQQQQQSMRVDAVCDRFMLAHRINPSATEAERATVEALLYIPGNGEDLVSPKLWVALGSDRVMVYDAATWIPEPTVVNVPSRVYRFLQVGEKHIWAAAKDGTIHVIAMETVAVSRKLLAHGDTISDLGVTVDNTKVYSGSLDGHVFIWNPETFENTDFFLPKRELIGISADDNENLWCGMRDSIVLVKEDGTLLKTLELYDIWGKPSFLECFLIKQNELWAGFSRSGEIIVWNLESWAEQTRLTLESCSGISYMVTAKDKVCVGTLCGKLNMISSRGGQAELENHCVAHHDTIRTICNIGDKYVATGSGSKDGRIAIWRVPLQREGHVVSSSSAEVATRYV
ncbi:PREDICTED: DENN domain-containing protein 3-like [Priapulus caudatus]|uniref:DENN domain-containing protein 3-like n=1 Tax=Priapulus caudatus TaxID=37621 RepID=A0ABM1DQF9_PRICU|nr:PREDICTED: DENN domain-containing protein 3-like [Priapulus caudatus]